MDDFRRGVREATIEGFWDSSQGRRISTGEGERGRGLGPTHFGAKNHYPPQLRLMAALRSSFSEDTPCALMRCDFGGPPLKTASEAGGDCKLE